jgi:hypothetical protein
MAGRSKSSVDLLSVLEGVVLRTRRFEDAGEAVRGQRDFA